MDNLFLLQIMIRRSICIMQNFPEVILGTPMSMIKVQGILHNTIQAGLLMVYRLQEGRFGSHHIEQGTWVRQKKKIYIYIYIYGKEAVMHIIQDCEISSKKDYEIYECFLLILTGWLMHTLTSFFLFLFFILLTSIIRCVMDDYFQISKSKLQDIKGRLCFS